MSIDPIVPIVPGVGGVAPANAASLPVTSGGLPEIRGADFSRILEELMSSASKIGERAAQATNDPKEIQAAVQEAGRSLDTALSLGQELLEAYRKTSIVEKNAPPTGKP